MSIRKNIYKFISLLCVAIAFVGILFSNEDNGTVCISENSNHMEYLLDSVHTELEDVDIFETFSLPQTFEAIRVSKYSSARPLRFSSIQAAISLLMLFVLLLLTSEILYLFIRNTIYRFHIITYIHNKDGSKSNSLCFS